MTTDNAGGGIRGLRAQPSAQLIDAVSTGYGVDWVDNPIDLGGSSNLNLRLGDSLVRVYRPYVTTDRLRAIQLVRSHLTDAGIPCNGLVSTRDGQPWLRFDNRLLEVERYVPHDAVMDTWERLESGLVVLGQIHKALRGLDIGEAGKHPMFANYISSTEALPGALHGIARIRSWDDPTLEVLADSAERLAYSVSYADDKVREELPVQLVHGDFWDNNVFYRRKALVFVTDFDYLGERVRIDDIALTFYFACIKFLERPVTDGQLNRLRALLDAYESGNGTRITAAERAALPLAIARQPLWSIGGWVASLDDDEIAHQHAASTLPEVEWALHLLLELPRWQAALA